MFIFNGRYDRFSKTLVFTVMAIVQIMVLLETRYTDRFFKVFSCKLYTVLIKTFSYMLKSFKRDIFIFQSARVLFPCYVFSKTPST